MQYELVMPVAVDAMPVVVDGVVAEYPSPVHFYVATGKTFIGTSAAARHRW